MKWFSFTPIYLKAGKKVIMKIFLKLKMMH